MDLSTEERPLKRTRISDDSAEESSISDSNKLHATETNILNQKENDISNTKITEKANEDEIKPQTLSLVENPKSEMEIETSSATKDSNLNEIKVSESKNETKDGQQSIIEQKQELLARTLAIRERELRELLYLESGGNILDFDENSAALTAALEAYHANHKLLESNSDSTAAISSAAQMLQEPKSSLSPSHRIVAESKGGDSLPTLKIQFKGANPFRNISSNNNNPYLNGGLELNMNIDTSNEPINLISDKDLSNLFTPTNSKYGANSDDISAKATKDAETLKRINDLEKEGLWTYSSKRLNKVAEPPRTKVHWDYLLSEMSWLANDFREERKWKMALAKKVSKQVQKYHEAHN